MIEKKILYLFLRKDLNQVQRAVQAAHVCLEAGRKFSLPDERYRIVILGIRSEAKLKEVELELQTLGVTYVLFNEPDLNNALTAIATIPLTEKEGQAFKRYRLLESE